MPTSQQILNAENESLLQRLSPIERQHVLMAADHIALEIRGLGLNGALHLLARIGLLVEAHESAEHAQIIDLARRAGILNGHKPAGEEDFHE